MSSTNILLWSVFPYIAISSFVIGLVWRFKYDKFNWTTRSSQIYEGKLLSIAGPLFHLGLFAVIGGHVVGLLVPQTLTDSLGLSHEAYHLGAVTMGGAAGIATLVGVLLFLPHIISCINHLFKSRNEFINILYWQLGFLHYDFLFLPCLRPRYT